MLGYVEARNIVGRKKNLHKEPEAGRTNKISKISLKGNNAEITLGMGVKSELRLGKETRDKLFSILNDRLRILKSTFCPEPTLGVLF
jgi:hypothetical protein